MRTARGSSLLADATYTPTNEHTMELVIRDLDGPRPAEQAVEVVERKGLGHPDTICDGRISVY